MQFALRLFRQSFEQVVRKGELPDLPSVLPEELVHPVSGVYAAAFEKTGRKPRGRVGTYLPTKPSLAEEIQAQAHALAVTFPFRRQDLPFLTYELLLTGTPQLITDLSDLRDTQGLLIRSGRGLQGVSLPAQSAKTSKDRYAEACAHAGIDARIDDVRMYTFGIDVVRDQGP